MEKALELVEATLRSRGYGPVYAAYEREARDCARRFSAKADELENPTTREIVNVLRECIEDAESRIKRWGVKCSEK